jgi:hypothetical protein
MCCEPNKKADCCGQETGCGCAAGASDMRETLRAREPGEHPI